MRYFKNLDVWRRAHQLTLDVYRTSTNFPRHERYGLASQIRRSAVSVPSNIAEGAARHSRIDFAHFLDIAVASITELEYQLLLAGDLDYLDESTSLQAQQECREIRSMLIVLRERVLRTED